MESLINSTTKALSILDCFTDDQLELTLSQINRITSIPKSTLLNHLRTLLSCGFLCLNKETQAYRLGYKVMQLSYFARKSIPIIQYASPLMEDLQEKTGEIIYLTTHINGRVFYLECQYPNRKSVSYSLSGKKGYMHSTGCGKAMLSQMPIVKVKDIIQTNGLFAITSKTITDEKLLFKDLEISRQRGYAIDNEEDSIGGRCIGMAVRSSTGEVAGALSISGSVLTMTDEKIQEYAVILSRACNALSPYAYSFPSIMFNNN